MNRLTVRAVLNETLRLFPPVSANMRSSTSKGCVIPSESSDKPFYIPPHTMILYSTMVIQRRVDYWGEDAEDFKPDRWMDPEKVAKRVSDFAFTPFSGGPRTVGCLYSPLQCPLFDEL